MNARTSLPFGAGALLLASCIGAQATVGPWTLTLKSGNSYGNVAACAANAPSVQVGACVILKALSSVAGPPFSVAGSACSRVVEATTTLTVGPSARYVELKYTMVGLLNDQAPGETCLASASVTLDGNLVLSYSPLPPGQITPCLPMACAPLAVNSSNGVVLCVPAGVHTVVAQLGTYVIDTMLTGGKTTTADFSTGALDGLTVCVTDKGPCSGGPIGDGGKVAPRVIVPKSNDTGLNPPNVPGTDVQQIHLVALPGDPPGIYLCGLTVSGLPSANGGQGGSDVVSGKYDVINDRFTPDLYAAAFNSTGTEFGLSFHHSGLIAVVDRLANGVWVGTRPNLSSAFTLLGRISNLPTSQYYDPSLANYLGQLHVLWADTVSKTIRMAPLNLGTLTIGTSLAIIGPARAGSEPNSPTPIVDSRGELLAVSHHDLVASDNDHYMSFDLDPATPALLMIDTPTWTNNGGFAGGTFIDAENTPAPYHAFSVGAIWWTGGRAAIGTTMDMSFFVPPSTTGPTSASTLAITLAYLPTPIPFPGLINDLGLDVSTLLTVNVGTHNPNNGKATLLLPIPGIASLQGRWLPAQSITLQVGGPVTQVVLGNTAPLVIER